MSIAGSIQIQRQDGFEHINVMGRTLLKVLILMFVFENTVFCYKLLQVHSSRLQTDRGKGERPVEFCKQQSGMRIVVTGWKKTGTSTSRAFVSVYKTPIPCSTCFPISSHPRFFLLTFLFTPC